MSALPLARLFGFEIRVHVSWAIILAIIAVTVATQIESMAPESSPLVRWSIGGIVGVAFLLSALAHELGHALAARRAGAPGRTIVVFFFGGAASPAIETATPRTEIVAAEQAGADLVKLFPVGPVGGQRYVKSVLEPLPKARLMVSGGVGPDEIEAYLRLGVCSVALGGALLPGPLLQARDWTGLETHARTIAARLEPAARGERCAQQAEIVRGHAADGHALGAVAGQIVERHVARCRDVVEYVGLGAPMDEIERRRGHDWRAVVRLVHYEYEPVGLGHSDRREQDSVDDAEDRRVEADADGEDQQRDRREPKVLAEHARRVSQILKQRFHRWLSRNG